MSARSLVAGVATTAVLAAALGSPAAQDAARDAENGVFAQTVSAFPSWDVGGAPADLVWSVVIRLAVLVVVTGLLCAVAGRSGHRGAAFLAGWAAAVVGAALAGAVAFAYLDLTVFTDAHLTGTYLDRLVGAANDGVAYGLWTGWLVGVAMALVMRPARAVAPARADQEAPVGLGIPGEAGHISEPPPPWWAPTAAIGEGGRATIRPGPSVFPPGGMPPVVAGLDDGDTGIMTTASGDPHPSDPEATQAVGLPPPDDATAEQPPEPEPADDEDPTLHQRRQDDEDPTLHLPRQD